MKKRLFLMAAAATLSYSCQGQQDQTKKVQPYEDDTNYQDRRKQMKQQNNRGCCEAEELKSEVQTPKTTVSAEVKVEKNQKEE